MVCQKKGEKQKRERYGGREVYKEEIATIERNRVKK